MKLFGFFAVFVSADERAFSNVPDFMSGNSDWWNSNNAVAQFDDLKVGADKFFADYWTTKAGARVGEKAAALLEDVRSDMLKISKSGKCTSAYRKRSILGLYVRKNFKNLVHLVASSNHFRVFISRPRDFHISIPGIFKSRSQKNHNSDQKGSCLGTHSLWATGLIQRSIRIERNFTLHKVSEEF